jgi:hypothetical protein
MELVLIGTGILASVVTYKIGYSKGKKDGYTVGHNHGMFKANELIAKEKARVGDVSPRSFVGVKHRLAEAKSSKEIAWIG